MADDSPAQFLPSTKSCATAMAATVPALHREHREAFEQFVVAEADPWHREHLTALYALWHAYNARYFAGQMTPPYLLLAEPITPRTYADTATATGFGARMQIRLRPSLMRGTHPHLTRGSQDTEGRQRFVDDILLHETIHQYHFEVLCKPEVSYDGHGPLFRDTANRIGAQLGLSLVRASKVPKKDRDLPSCAQWPHNVRPRDYYRGAVRAWTAAPDPEEVLYLRLLRMLHHVDRPTLERLCARLLANKKQGDTLWKGAPDA